MQSQNTDMMRAEGAMVRKAASVLCIIDFTESSMATLHASIEIAAASKSQVTVLYPYRLTQPRSISDVSQWKRSIDLDARNNFARMTESLFKENKVVCEFKPEVGFINDRVSAYAEKNRIGMIVISKEMAIANREAIADMLTNLECPLLIVPRQ